MANEINNAAAVNTAASAASASSSLSGIHEIQINLEDLTRDFYQKAEKFYDYIEKAFNSMIGKTDAEMEGKKNAPDGVSLLGKKKEKDSPAVKVTKTLKVDKLIDFQDSVAGLGVVLHNDFQDLFKRMDKDNSKKAKGGGLKGLFDGLESGSKGLLILAGALAAFAVSAIAFQFVDWPAAVKGLLLFTGFVTGTIILAKLVGKEKRTLESFAKNVLYMTLSYAAFGLSLFVVSNLLKYCDLPNLVASLALFAGFVAGTIAVAKLVNKSSKDFMSFAKGVLIMTGAYVAFGVALVIVSQLAKFIDWPGLLATMGLFAAFIAGTVAVSKLLSKGQGDLVQFALGSMLMSVAFLAFGGAIAVISRLNADIGTDGWLAVVGTLGIMAVIIAGASIAAKFADPVALILLATSSILMAAGFTAFGFAIKILSELTVKELLKGALIIAGVTAFYIAIGALGTATLPFMISSVIMFAALAASSALMLVAMIPFKKAVDLINQVDINGQTLLNVLGIAGIMTAFAAIGVASLAATPGVALFAAFSALASPALGNFIDVLLKLQTLHLVDATVKKIKLQLGHIGSIITAMEDNLAVGAGTLAKISSFALMTKPVIKAIDSAGNIIKKIATLNKIKIDQTKFTQLLGIIQSSLLVMSDQAKNFKGKAGQAAIDMAAALVDVTASINTIADVVLKLCDLDSSRVDNANEHIKYLMKNLFVPTGDPNNPHILDLFDYLPSISKGALRAAEALVPITEAVDNLANTIIMIGTVDPTTIANGMRSLQDEMALMQELSTVLRSIAGDAETGILFWKSDTFEKANTALSKIGDCINTIQTVIPADTTRIDSFASTMSALNALGTTSFNGDTFKNKITALGLGLSAIKDDDIIGKIKDIGDGLATVDVSTVEKINIVMDTFSNLNPQITSINNMASALHTLNAELKEFGSLSEAADATSNFDKKHAKTTTSKSTSTTSTTNTTNNTGTSEYGETIKNIYNILETWAQYGILMQNNESPAAPSPAREAHGGL